MFENGEIPSSNFPRVQMIETVFRAKIWKLEQNIWKIPWADGYFGGIISNYLSADDMYWEFDGKP